MIKMEESDFTPEGDISNNNNGVNIQLVTNEKKEETSDKQVKIEEENKIQIEQPKVKIEEEHAPKSTIPISEQ